MSFKRYSVQNSKTNDVLEEFDSAAAAEQFCLIMSKKGIQTTVKTKDEDFEETPDEFIIDGLEVEEPQVEFGSELDDEFSDNSSLYDWDKDKPDYEVEE